MAAVAGGLLAKHGLEPKALHQTNILDPETSAQQMVSKEVIRVKHAPDMNFMESVRHFTFLLSKKNLKFVNGGKAQEPKNLASKIEGFSETIQQALATYYSQNRKDQTPVVSNDLRNSSSCTADVATAMFRESRKNQNSE